MNNHLKSENLSFARIQKNFRPYLVEGTTVYRDAPVYRLLARNSQLFRFIDHRAEKLQVALYGRIPDAQRLELARLYPAAEATTRQILESEYRPRLRSGGPRPS